MSQYPEKNESLDWKHQGLDPQEQGVDEPDGIHRRLDPSVALSRAVTRAHSDSRLTPADFHEP